MTSSSNSFQSTCPTGKNYPSFLDFTRNNEQISGIFRPLDTDQTAPMLKSVVAHLNICNIQ